MDDAVAREAVPGRSGQVQGDQSQVTFQMDLRTALGWTRRLGRAYDAHGLPATLLNAANGTLADMYLGQISREALAAAKTTKLKTTGDALEVDW